MPNSAGKRDSQSVLPGGRRAVPSKIAGVKIVELGNVLTRSGWMSEVFRKDWPEVEIAPQQINWVELSPNGVTDWHRHANQTDHLIGIGGVIKLALWDGRADSTTTQESDVVRMGAIRPVMVIIPPGVWHALRNESGQPAGYLNVVNQLYSYECPDNWRLTPGMAGIPNIL
jgi:dTDP-4-dehydrorhamnose 3,5-epimerase